MGAAAIPLIAGAAISAYGQGQAGKAQAGYYNYLSATSRTNAGLTEAEGIAEGRQINAQAGVIQRNLTDRINTTVGEQVAGSVSGAGASSRTAQDIVKDTLNQGELDQETLNYNTNTRTRNSDIASRMQSFNFMTQASGYKASGANALSAARIGQVGSLLGGASSVAQSYWMADIYGGRNNPNNFNADRRGTAGIDYQP